jgi:hypothetical protein
MKTHTLLPYAAALVASLAVSLPPDASADLLAYEGFDYAAGSSLAGQNGGFGFAGAWGTSPGIANITIPSLTAGGVNTTGGKLFVMGDTTGSVAIFRDLAAGRGDDGTTTWISLLGLRTGTTSGTFGPDGSPSLVRPVNFSLFQAGSEILAIGEGTRTSGISLPDTDTWGLVDRGGVNNAGTRWTGASLLVESFVLVRIDHGVGDLDTAYLWVNPSLAAEPTLDSAMATTMGNWNFNRVRPFAGNPSTASGGIGAEGYLDEFRLGTTWADVAPVPEPSTYALIGLGALALILYRKRINA